MLKVLEGGNMKGYELLKEARRLSGMKQKDMAKYFYMPYRTRLGTWK